MNREKTLEILKKLLEKFLHGMVSEEEIQLELIKKLDMIEVFKLEDDFISDSYTL